MEVISRAQWGAKEWQGSPREVPLSERRDVYVHWWGDVAPRNERGFALMKEVEAIHLSNGWAGVGYNFVVDQGGVIYEGRGWGLQGAHCHGHNRDGIGILIAVGKRGDPATDAALRSARWLYDEACRKTGRIMGKKGHRDGSPTECPGSALYAWVREGMKAPQEPVPPVSSPAPPSGIPVAGGTYVVRPRDNLAKIAAQVPGVTWLDIARGNGIRSPYRIHPGQELSIPQGRRVRATVSLSRLIAAAKTDPPKSGTPVSYPGVKTVENALVKEGLLTKGLADGHYGTATVAAYAAWQRKLGFSGRDADGIPGRTSLTRLGGKYNFVVKD